MPVIGLVLNWSPDASAEAARRALQADPRFTLAPEPGQRGHAAVLDTDSRDADRAAWRWLESLEGVSSVEVVFADFSDLTLSASSAEVTS